MERKSNYGIPYFSIIGFIFIVLKLTNHIDWDWIWVLSPFWIPVSIIVIILMMITLFLLVVVICKAWIER